MRSDRHTATLTMNNDPADARAKAVESSAAQANEWRLKINEALSSAWDLKYKLQRTERELAASKFKSLRKEAERQTADWESKLQEEKSKQDEAKKCANLEQELLDKTSALEKQLETETSSLLQRKRAAKEALLDAKEKIKLMTTKIEVFTKESDNLATINEGC